MSKIAAYVFAIFAIVVGSVVGGILLHFYWGWFVVPPLSVTPLSISHAIGLYLAYILFQVFMTDIRNAEDLKTASEYAKGMLERIFTGALSWAMGYIGHLILTLV